MLYLRICVFASQTPRNIIFEVLLPLPFQKCSSCPVYQQLWPMLYLCICICVFASQTPRNIVFEVLLPIPFQKYSTCHVCVQLWPMLYLRICVFQRWANNSVFEYYSNNIRIPNYSYSYSVVIFKPNNIRIRVDFSNRIIFVFVFGEFFQTE